MPSTSALITLPSAVRLRFILMPSRRRSPVAPVLDCRSLPARSTRLSLPTFGGFGAGASRGIQVHQWRAEGGGLGGGEVEGEGWRTRPRGLSAEGQGSVEGVWGGSTEGRVPPPLPALRQVDWVAALCPHLSAQGQVFPQTPHPDVPLCSSGGRRRPHPSRRRRGDALRCFDRYCEDGVGAAAVLLLLLLRFALVAVLNLCHSLTWNGYGAHN